MKPWQLIDSRNPADSPEAFPKVAIQSEAQLRKELNRLRELDPAIVALEGPTEQALQIGIGGPFAGIRLYKAHQPYRVVLADRTYSEKRIDFASEEETMAFWPSELIPAEQAIEAIVSFFQDQALPDWIGWKEWNSNSKKWSTKLGKGAAPQAV